MSSRRVISQETFDQAVRENVEEFEMEIAEAVEEACQQFSSQGVELSNIAKEYEKDEDGKIRPKTHPLKASLGQLQDSVAASNTEGILECLIKLTNQLKDATYQSYAATQNAHHSIMLACRHFQDEENLPSSLDALGAMIGGQSHLVDESIIEFLCTCARKYQNNASVVEHVTRVIRKACIMREMNRQSFVKKGIIPVFLENLQIHNTVVKVVQETSFALRVLIFDDDMSVPFGKAHEHAKSIASEHGGLAIVLDTMTRYTEDPETISELCLLLSALAVRDEYCKEIADKGGLKLVLDVLEKNLKNASIARQVCSVLRALAGNDDIKRTVVDVGGLNLIILAMETHIKHAAVVDQGCAALAALALRQPTNSKVIVSSGGKDVILKSMQLHPDSLAVQKNACLAIRNIVSRNSELVNPFLDSGAEHLIQTASTKHPGCADLAKAALRDLGCKVELKELWTGQSGEKISH